jgi:hypothetical protein
VTKSIAWKLQRVQELLSSVAEETGAAILPSSPSHWELPLLPPPDPEGRLSSTDLLNWWYLGPRSGGEGWDDDYGPALADDGHVERPRGRATMEDRPEPSADRWAELSFLLPEPEEHLAEEHAQAAVDCLYDFLHAVGLKDTDAALSFIDDNYHTIEDGQEIDRDSFRNTLQAFIEAQQNWKFEISLAAAPEPINHPLGVLIDAKIQFDAVNSLSGAKNCRVDHRLAILRPDEFGAWKITALVPLGG